MSSNADLLATLQSALEKALRDQQSQVILHERVKLMLKANLAGGRPDIQQIAAELSLSERSLQRRLALQGKQFQTLLTEARQEKARDYLRDAQLGISEIAFLLGFDDQNSFYRVFRAWEGITPNAWRVAATEPKSA